MAAAATMYGIKTTAAVLAFSSGAQLSGLRVAGTTTDSTTEKTTPACTKEFQQGAIYVAFQNASGSAIANGPLRDKYNSVGGLTPGSSFLGYLTGDHVRALPDGQGQMARFQNGVIYYPPTTGAHPVSGPLLDMWAAEGYEQGAHKYPTADQVNLEAPRIEQQFQIGKLEWPAFTDVAENNITTYETTKTSLLSEAMVSRARIQIYDGTDPSVSARALPTTGQPTECTTGRKNDSRTVSCDDYLGVGTKFETRNGVKRQTGELRFESKNWAVFTTSSSRKQPAHVDSWNEKYCHVHGRHGCHLLDRL